MIKGIKICLFCIPRSEILHLSIAWFNLAHCNCKLQVSRRTVLDDSNLPNTCLCEMKRCDITIFLNSNNKRRKKIRFSPQCYQIKELVSVLEQTAVKVNLYYRLIYLIKYSRCAAIFTKRLLVKHILSKCQ